VATLGDEPVGHILFTESPLLVAGSSRGALAPLAVRPDLQRRGSARRSSLLFPIGVGG
jgi:predicted N-acetyltransferase YhbS